MIVIAVIILIFSLIAWIGQAITLFWPTAAVKMAVTEPESEVAPAFYADVRGEAFWDILSIWTLPVAAILLILDNSA